MRRDSFTPELKTETITEMQQRTYQVTLKGATDMLMHRDNIEFSDRVRKWAKDPANKGLSVPGDDRSPGWTWLGCLYINNGLVVVDSDNIMAMLRDGGKKCPAPTGRGSMKSQTQSGIMCNEIGWPLLVSGKSIDANKFMAMTSVQDFEEHEKAAKDDGFTLFVKRAVIGSSKHVRVRPRFENWSATGTVTVVDQTITTSMLETIFRFAGQFCGIGDWRPSSKTPGPWGRFEAEVTELR